MKTIRVLYGCNVFYDITECLLQECPIVSLSKSQYLFIPSQNAKLDEMADKYTVTQYITPLLKDTPVTNRTVIVEYLNLKDRSDQKVYFPEGTDRIVSLPNTLVDFLNVSRKYPFGEKVIGEFEERVLAIHFIKKDDIVLEIGANIGRNSVTIASKLENSDQLTCIECDEEACNTLLETRKKFNMNFFIINTAISPVRLFQKGWDTIPIDSLTPEHISSGEWKEISTVTWPELKAVYNKPYNTLVIDCEGAFYNIVKTYPDILNGIRKIIIENDFKSRAEYEFVRNVLLSLGFRQEVAMSASNNPDFYSVWMK